MSCLSARSIFFPWYSLTGLWFAAIFAFRMGLAFLEVLPQLGLLAEDHELSPFVKLLTWHPILTSLAPAIVLGPLTHSAITGAALFRMYEAARLEEAEMAEEIEDESAA